MISIITFFSWHDLMNLNNITNILNLEYQNFRDYTRSFRTIITFFITCISFANNFVEYNQILKLAARCFINTMSFLFCFIYSDIFFPLNLIVHILSKVINIFWSFVGSSTSYLTNINFGQKSDKWIYFWSSPNFF